MSTETRRVRRTRGPTLRVVLPPPEDEGGGERGSCQEIRYSRGAALHDDQYNDSRAARDGSSVRGRRAAKPARRLPPEILTDDEVCAMMRACGRYAPTGLRNRALIALLYRTGLRINEALYLYPKDLNLADGSVRVLNGKGGKSRTVGLDPGATAIIERWLDARSRCLALALRIGKGDRNANDNGEAYDEPGALPHNLPSRDSTKLASADCRNAFGRCPIFCTLRGEPMADAYIRVMLKRLAARAGIDKRVHAHGFRHTHAAQLRAEGIDIAIISRQLGHASITTTARYLDHIAPKAVIEAMRNRTWTGE